MSYHDKTIDKFVAMYTAVHGPLPSEEEMEDDQKLRATVDSRIRALQWEEDWKPQIDGFTELTGMTRPDALLFFLVQRMNDHVVASRATADATLCIDSMLHHYFDQQGEDWKHSQ